MCPTENEIVGLSTDFKVIDITNKAISMLNHTPDVRYDWIEKGEKLIFDIDIKKSEEDILFNNQKFVRQSSDTVLENNNINRTIINEPKFKRTIAIIISIENYFPKQMNPIQPVKYANNDVKKFKEILLHKFNVVEEYRLIYYVGHGFHDEITNYISTYDMSKTDIFNTAISLRSVLLDHLKKSPCKNALIFIDACAQKITNKYSRNIVSNINDEELIIF